MSGGPEVSVRAVEVPSRRKPLQRLAPGVPGRVEMLLLLDTACCTKV